MKAVIDGQPEAIAILDRSLRFLAVNAAWTSTIGFGDQAIGRTVLELLGGVSKQVAMGMKTALAGREVITTITTPHDGRLRQLAISPWRDQTGEIGGVFTRHSVEADLRQRSEGRERRLRMAMEMAQVFAYEIDFRTGEIAYEPFDPEGVEDLRFHSYEDMLSMLPEAERELQREVWERHLATGTRVLQEYPRFGPDGELVWQLTALEAIRDRTNAVVGVVGMTQIISDRKRAELALVAEKEAAQAADRAKSEFLANMSHEIRTPLTSVIGFADLLRKTDGLPDTAKTYVERISAAGQSLLSVINDVLDFSKLDAGQLELDPHAFSPAEFVEDVVGLLATQAANKGLELALEVATDLPARVVADSARIRQVLINLVGNGVKFTEAGRIIVTTRYVGGTPGQLQIAVSDTGPGIAEDQRDRLFQRFSQVDGSVSRRHGGTGLGLAICKSLIELMGGSFGVDSEFGRGSTFWFTVPVAIAEAPTEPTSRLVCTDLESRPAHILLVDDLAVNRELVRAMLTPLGHRFEEADNGADAVRAAIRTRFDLILMDLQMPGMDGFAAARAIRDTAVANRCTPILALSANVLAEHTAAAQAAGMDDHIAKPIRPAELLTKVAMWTSAALDEDRINKAS